MNTFKTALGALLLLATTAAIAADHPQVELQTSMGSITIELYPEQAPQSVDNFLTYVRDGFYKGTLFHRVIRGFMVQGGGFDVNFDKKPTRAPIKNEAGNGLKNETGTVAMARTDDPHSATSQFFINVADNGFLNQTAPSGQGWGYAVFGKVIKGMDVVNKIASVQTGAEDVPVQPVVIESAKIVSPSSKPSKK